MTTKTVYSYHPETKEYTGTDIAYASPLEENFFIIPANSTEKKPIFESNKITKWDGQDWVLEEIPLPTPLPEPSLQELQQSSIFNTKAKCASIITAFYPEYKQMNFLAKIAIIQNKEILALKNHVIYQLSEEEKQVLEQAQKCESFIASTRKKSNEIEQNILTMSLEELKAFDPSDDSNWS